MEAAAAIYHAPDREETILVKVSLSEIRKRRLEEGAAGRRPAMLSGRDTATHTELHGSTMTILALLLLQLDLKPFGNNSIYPKRIHIRSSLFERFI